MIRILRIPNHVDDWDEIPEIHARANIERILMVLQTANGTLSSPRELVERFWPEAEFPKIFKLEYDRLRRWSYRRELAETSQHVDEMGNPLTPAKWNGGTWKASLDKRDIDLGKYLLQTVRHRQLEDIKQGCTEQVYWYRQGFGVLSIPPEKTEEAAQLAFEVYFETYAKGYEHVNTQYSERFHMLQKPGDQTNHSSREPCEESLDPQRKQGRIRVSWPRLRKPMLLTAILALSAFTVVSTPNIWELFRRTLHTDGIDAATEQLSVIETEEQSQEKLYLLAYAAYRKKEFQKASKIIEANFHDENSKWYPYAVFLQGTVLGDQNQFEEAIFFLEEAVELFLKKDDFENYALALGTLGRAYIFLGEYEQAKIHLRQAEPFISTVHSVFYLRLWSLLSLHLGDLTKALEYTEQGIESLVTEENENRSFLYSDLAYLYALRGDCRSATEYVALSDNIVYELNDTEAFVYNRVIDLAISKCKNEPISSAIYKTVVEYLSQHDDPHLQDHLYRILGGQE